MAVARRLERFIEAERSLWDSVGLTPSERMVPLRTGEVVRVQETGDGPPVLLIHGASNAGASWASLMARLPDFRCIALDRPGCGLSEPLATGPLADIGAVEQFADRLVAEVLDGLELPSAHVLATSYGGYFALRGTAANPERVVRLVSYSWPMGAPMERVPLSMRISVIPGMQTATSAIPVTRGAARVMLSQVGLKRALRNGRFDEVMLDWFVALLRDTNTMRNDLRSSPRVITPVRGLNARVLLDDDVLGRVTPPTLFLWGEEDPNGGEAVARTFVARLPDAELEMIEEAGHAPWIDELDHCAERTRAFLTS